MPKSKFRSRESSHFNVATNPNDVPHASLECVDKCRILNGSDATAVYEELDDRGVPTGWVAIFGSNNMSQLLISLPPPNSNEDYLEAIKHCVNSSTCQSACPLNAYTLGNYIARGEFRP